jgi:hypothetical protein
VTIFSQATSTDGFPLSYTWTAPSGWTAQGGTTSSTLVLKAPATFNTTGQVLLQVDDGQGAKASASTVVTTGADSAPTASVIATPSNPQIGNAVALLAYASATGGQAVTYAWTLVQSPVGSHATLTGTSGQQTGFTPDVAGTYGATLLVTDASGLTDEVLTSVTVSNPNPVASIGGTLPLAATVSQPLVIDATSSTNPAGNPLTYAWSITSWPAGSVCGGSGCLASVGNGSEVKFTADIAGSFSILLTVTDPTTGLNARAQAAITATGGQQLNVLTGSGQQPTVHQTLATPIVVQLTSSASGPIASAGLSWTVTNGTILSSSSSTDTNGRASAVVQAGRLAQQGAVTVYVTANPSLTQTVTFAPQADQPASYTIGAGNIGTADGSTTVTVQVTDQFGNFTGADSVANSATMTLAVQSGSTKANLGSASTGNVTNLMNPSPGQTTATITLSGGKFSVPVTDTAAETISVSISQVATGRVLPFAAWNTALVDGAEGGLTHWNVENTGSAVTSWNTETTTVKDGTEAFGLSYAAAQQQTNQESDLILKSALSSSNPLTLVTFASNVQVTGASDTTNNCVVQPDFRLRLSSGSTGGSYTSVAPLSGYSVLNNCSGGPSLGASNGWAAVTADLTSAVASGYQYLDFEGAYVTDTNVPNETTAASWAVDDVWIQTLSQSSSASATASVTIYPGAPASLVLTASNVLLGQCVNGSEPTTLNVNVLDRNGNTAQGATSVVISWTGATGTVTPMVQTSVASMALSQNGMSFKMGPGGAEFFLSDTATSDTLSVTATAPGTSLGTPASVSSGQLTYHCHGNGFGQSWSDQNSNGGQNSTDALYACEAYYGANNCALSSNNSFAYSPTANTCGTYIWTFTNWSSTAGACVGTQNAGAGQVERVYAYASGACSCGTGAAGATSNVQVQYYTNWN